MKMYISNTFSPAMVRIQPAHLLVTEVKMSSDNPDATLAERMADYIDYATCNGITEVISAISSKEVADTLGLEQSDREVSASPRDYILVVEPEPYSVELRFFKVAVY